MYVLRKAESGRTLPYLVSVLTKEVSNHCSTRMPAERAHKETITKAPRLLGILERSRLY